MARTATNEIPDEKDRTLSKHTAEGASGGSMTNGEEKAAPRGDFAKLV
jgi:hypothetical protein